MSLVKAPKFKGFEEVDKQNRQFRPIESKEGIAFTVKVCCEDNTFKAERIRRLKKDYRFDAVCDEANTLVRYISMEYKDFNAACRWLKIEKNMFFSPYIRETATFAAAWAKYMQWLMKKHDKQLADIVGNAFVICNTLFNNEVTQFKVKCAVNLLAPCWKYGDELQEWYREEYGYVD